MPSKLPQSSFRLSDEDRELMRVIRQHFGLPSDTAAMRYAIRQVAGKIAASETPPTRPKVRQASKP